MTMNSNCLVSNNWIMMISNCETMICRMMQTTRPHLLLELSQIGERVPMTSTKTLPATTEVSRTSAKTLLTNSARSME